MSRSNVVAVGRLEVGDDDAPDVALVDLAVAEAAEAAPRQPCRHGDGAADADDRVTASTCTRRRSAPQLAGRRRPARGTAGAAGRAGS